MAEKILYFDCASGISGDMTLGALLDLGADEQLFLREIERLHLEGCHITIEETQKNGIRAKHVDVHVEGEEIPAHGAECAHGHAHGEKPEHTHDAAEHAHGGAAHAHGEKPEHTHDAAEYAHGGEEHTHGHAHSEEAAHTYDGEEHAHGHAHGGAEHAHPHRTFADIRAMIGESDLSEEVKALALRIFGRVAAAEAKVHGKSVDEVHFHEVGAVDSIVDIVGCAILICDLRPQAVYASVVHEGHGYVRCQHGLLSVPVPATSEIFAQAQVPLMQIDVDGELVTPTGAAIIAELAASFGNMPPMRIRKIGWGAGTKDLPIPNVLKVYEGYAQEDVTPDHVSTNPDGAEQGQPGGATACGQGQSGGAAADGQELRDEVAVLETNLDDCTGEMLGRAMEILMEAGALDVFFTPIFMKKNRPAYRLTVLAKPEQEGEMERLLFLHTTTIGVRKRRETRTVLRREPAAAKTPFGEIKGKKVYLDGAERTYPEYESAAELAKQHGVSLWEIYRSYE